MTDLHGNHATRHDRKPTRAKQLGITDDAYHAMLEAQDGRCAVQGCPSRPKTRRFHVDHDHRTGQVRGLLCHYHNRFMPRSSDEAHRLYLYLRQWETHR